MLEAGLTFSADAMLQASAAIVNNELIVSTPKRFQLDLGREEIGTALKFDMLPLERAVSWLHEIDTLHLVNPDVWREPPVAA